MKVYVFPCMTIVLALGAALVYGIDGDIRRCVYWCAAAVITAAVTF